MNTFKSTLARIAQKKIDCKNIIKLKKKLGNALAPHHAWAQWCLLTLTVNLAPAWQLY